MIDKHMLCDKIRELYPDIGQCQIDIKVDYDANNGAWIVDLKKDHKHLRTFLEDEDAAACLIGQKCVGLGIEIAQLRGNLDRLN